MPRQSRAIGAPSSADIPNALLKAANQSSLTHSYSIREPPFKNKSIPSLESLCCRIFAVKLTSFFDPMEVVQGVACHPTGKAKTRRTRRLLLRLPDHLVNRLLNALRLIQPDKLSHTFLAQYFLRGTSIKFSSSMAGINKRTVAAIGEIGSSLLELELSGLSWIGDSAFAHCIKQCKNLTSLNLKWSAKAALKTADAISKCGRLQMLNINYTSIPAVTLANIIRSCPSLEVLKVASLPNFTDATMNKIVMAIQVSTGSDTIFPSLKVLKLRHDPVTESSLLIFLSFFPSLSSLDLAFTPVSRIPLQISEIPFPPIYKLMLTSSRVNANDLFVVLEKLPKLQKLHLGAVSFLSRDLEFARLTEVLATFCPEIEDISLVGHDRSGSGLKPKSVTLRGFVRRIGRKCKYLNLASTFFNSEDLVGLLPGPNPDLFPDELDIMVPFHAPLLRTLNLNRTKIDDAAAEYLAACTDLETLELEGTRITTEGLFTVVDSCERLEVLNLSGCRGVKVTDRRCFFEIWEDARVGGS